MDRTTYKIIDCCEHIEDYALYDHKAISHHFEIKYKENQVIINLYYTYIINDKYKTKQQEQKIIHNITLEEFCNFIIYVYETKLHIGEFSIPIQRENIIKNMKIEKIK